MKKIADLTTAEMVAEYNALTGKSIKKFSSRAAGEKQLAAARSAQPQPTSEKKQMTTKEETPVAPKSEKRSIAISESWSNDKIAKKRARRDNVAVEGVGTFRSVCEAFKKLNLPLNQHIKFRMHVKASGDGVFETGDKTYHFKLVEQKKLDI